MTDMRVEAPASAGAGGPMGFLRETVASLADRRLLAPALLLTLLLTASNIVILKNPPLPGEPPTLFAIAALARLVGLFALAVAILRVLAGSSRRPYMPDGAFWLYGVTLVFGLVLTIALGLVAGDRTEPVAGALIGLGMIVVSAPLAPWFTAMAVERPLAVDPRPWLRGFGRWLPPLLLWSVLIVLPLGQLHAAIDIFLLRGAGDYFWPLALADGPLSAFLAIFGLALAVTAYRSVARG